MNQSYKVLGNQALKYAMTGVAVTCLGAAVFAAPLTITPKPNSVGVQPQGHEIKSAFAPLGTGPALQLDRAGAGEEEDCVRVTRIVGPDGRIYVTRGLVCQE